MSRLAESYYESQEQSRILNELRQLAIKQLNRDKVFITADSVKQQILKIVETGKTNLHGYSDFTVT